MPKSNKVIIPSGITPYPENHEITAADILARFFKADVEFIKRSSHRTPDIMIGNLRWEIKSPTGKGKHNIQHQLQVAALQSPNIVLDSRRSKIHQTRIDSEAERQFKIIKRAKKLIIITKSGKVLEIKK
ncbi:hypothetical protein FACS189431_8220 [Alphaproteobacteria bacterium]|nr:hypothetical protein FACS189431_8220 [Alphaproteobacteria bacterium]